MDTCHREMLTLVIFDNFCGLASSTSVKAVRSQHNVGRNAEVLEVFMSKLVTKDSMSMGKTDCVVFSNQLLAPDRVV